MNWLDMPQLNGIGLTDSYVLGWNSSDHQVVIQMDYALYRDHPEYSEPLSSEWACFKRGLLTFLGVSSIVGLPLPSQVRHNTDATGEKDYGEIEALSANGHSFTISFEFGVVNIVAWTLSAEVLEHKNSVKAEDV